MSVCLYKQLQSCDSGLSLTHSAVAASPQIPTEWISFKRSPRCYKYTPLLNIDRIAPSLSPISVFFHLFFFLSVWASTTPPLPPSPPCFFPFPWGLCALPSRAEPEASLYPGSHWLSLTTWSQSGPPCSAIRPALWVFTWNNSTAAVGREQGPGKSERGRDAEPKMDMANLFKHFFREFLNFPCLL